VNHEQHRQWAREAHIYQDRVISILREDKRYSAFLDDMKRYTYISRRVHEAIQQLRRETVYQWSILKAGKTIVEPHNVRSLYNAIEAAERAYKRLLSAEGASRCLL